VEEEVMKRTFIPLTIVALAALALAAPAVQAKDDQGRIIPLKASSAFPGAKGKAKFKTDGQRELEIEVEHVRRLAGQRVNFFVNAKRVGSLRINGFGAAELNRRGSSVPAISSGTRISVKTASGRLIVSGRF
jgi:hypothetical protein